MSEEQRQFHRPLRGVGGGDAHGSGLPQILAHPVDRLFARGEGLHGREAVLLDVSLDHHVQDLERLVEQVLLFEAPVGVT